uniref:Unc-50-like protein n=1 Tax=Romanomermis culicivorax TaxID=13658 RepID=A0A915J381_ROMCU
MSDPDLVTHRPQQQQESFSSAKTNTTNYGPNFSHSSSISEKNNACQAPINNARNQSSLNKAKFSGYSSPRYPTSPGNRCLSRGSIVSLSSSKDYGCLAHVRMTAGAKITRFFKRLFNYKQMDFEFAVWQMLFLLAAPQRVYRNFMYRKRTKDQWARDDPAFLVLLSAVLSATSILYAFILDLSFIGFLKFFFWVVFVDCIITGLIIATFNWFLTNTFLRVDKDQDVEWGYCFDVHLNAFFPILIFLHTVMPLLYPVLISKAWFLSRFVGNSLWLIAIGYYLYITFLGFTALPFVKNTHIFLYPFSFLFILYVVLITIGWNVSQTVMWFYHYRIA